MLNVNHRLLKILVIALVIVNILRMSETISFTRLITDNINTSIIIIGIVIVIKIIRIVIIIWVDFFNKDLINTAVVVVGRVTIIVVVVG